MTNNQGRNLSDLIEDSKIKVATVVGIIVFFLSLVTGTCLFIFKESQWRTNIQRDILETRNAVNEIKQIVEKNTGDRFTYAHMKTWVTRFKELNESSDIKIPSLPTRSP